MQIAAASQEQLQGVQSVSTGIRELDIVTQNNAANAEELASTAVETAEQVQGVRRIARRHVVSAAPPGREPAGRRSSAREEAFLDDPRAPLPLFGLEESKDEFPMEAF